MLGTHVITDESVRSLFAAVLSPIVAVVPSWPAAWRLFLLWNVLVLLGVALESSVRNTNSFRP